MIQFTLSLLNFQFKGSLGSLSEVERDGVNNDIRLKYDDCDYNGSQSSLLSFNEKAHSRGAGQL